MDSKAGLDFRTGLGVHFASRGRTEVGKKVVVTRLATRLKPRVLAPYPAGWSIIVLGIWNARVITPQWIGNGRLTAANEIELAVPMDDPLAPRVFSFEEVQLEIHFSRIMLRPLRAEDDVLQRMQVVCGRILTELSQTPVSATGVNFSFIEDQPNAAMMRLFDFPDNGRLAEQDWVIQGSTIRREVHKNDSVVNLASLLQGDGSVRFEFNFHFNTATPEAARGIVNGDLLAKKNEALNLIRHLYSI